MFPLKMHVLQKLEDVITKPLFRLQDSARIISQNMSCFVERVLFCNNYAFHVDGDGNERIVRIWGAKSPSGRIGVAKDSGKLTVWCTMSVKKIFDPNVF